MGTCIGRDQKLPEPCEITSRGHLVPEFSEVPRDRPIKVMCWNIQFCAGRKHLFFYEGGDAVLVPLEEVQQTMRCVAEVIADAAPDVVLLQEVDRNSTRTQHMDELEGILELLEQAGHQFPFVAATPYHRVCYVPTPWHQPLGRVDLNLVTLSKFPLRRATRYPLPLLKESCLRQAFDLKRAVMEVELPVQGGSSLILLNTHLSAFAFQDGTPEKESCKKEIAQLVRHAQHLEGEGVPWVLAGDLNMLPPGDDPRRFGVINNFDHNAYYCEDSPIFALTQVCRSAMDPEDHRKEPGRFRTYLPLGYEEADRVLDWIFVGTRLEIEHYEVLHKHRHVPVASDHLPLLLQFRL